MVLEVNPFRETLVLGSLNVALPTVDVYSDIALAVKLYSNTREEYVTYIDETNTWVTIPVPDGHPIWATVLLIPFLVNYLLGWRAWYYKETQNKKYTWTFALLGCYPQFVAGRIIWLFWTKPEKAVKEKKHLERNIIENEIFTEAVPSATIMTFLLAINFDWQGDLPSHLGILGSEYKDAILFLVTFATSVLSAGLGLAKGLKVATECRKVRHRYARIFV